MPDNAHTLVLGLGNPLRGDDGVGPAVIAALHSQGAPAGVTLLDGGTAGLEMLLLWEGYARVIVVDSAEIHSPPGRWQRVDLSQTRLSRHPLTGTLHTAGLAEALALAEALDRQPPELILFGVQPHSLAWEAGLSLPVTAALPDLCRAVRDSAESPLTHPVADSRCTG